MEVAAQLLASGKLKASAATLERHLNEEKDKEVIKYGINTVETEAALRKGVVSKGGGRAGCIRSWEVGRIPAVRANYGLRPLSRRRRVDGASSGLHAGRCQQHDM